MTASILPSIALQILTVRSAFIWDYFIGINQFYVHIEQGLLGYFLQIYYKYGWIYTQEHHSLASFFLREVSQ